MKTTFSQRGQIEYDISLSIKQQGRRLDEERSYLAIFHLWLLWQEPHLAAASDALFERCWTSEHDQQLLVQRPQVY